MIFKECIANGYVTNVLRACKQLHDEFIPFLYEALDLVFHIDPTDPAARIKIIGWRDDVYHGIGSLDNHRDSPTIVDHMPLDSFKSIQVIIAAPDPKDPGQLVRCWKQCTSCMEVLLPQWEDLNELPESLDDYKSRYNWDSRELPPVSIEFVENREKRWASSVPYSHSYLNGESMFDNGVRWNHSVPSYKEDLEQEEDYVTSRSKGQFRFSDVEILLRAFGRIREAECVNVKLPPWTTDMLDEEVDFCVKSLQRRTDLLGPFGLIESVRDRFVVSHTLSKESSMHLWLDYLLDDLDGPAAALLRRQRYETWCDEYEYLHFQRLAGYDFLEGDDHWFKIGMAASRMEESLLEEIKRAFRARYAAGRKHAKEIMPWIDEVDYEGDEDSERRILDRGHASKVPSERPRWEHNLKVPWQVWPWRYQKPPCNKDASETQWEFWYPLGMPRRSEDNYHWQPDDGGDVEQDRWTGEQVDPFASIAMEPLWRPDLTNANEYGRILGTYCKSCEVDKALSLG